MNRVEYAVRNLLAAIAFVAVLVLVLLMIITALDVSMRATLKLPIYGSVEIVTHLMVFLVFLGIPWYAYKNEHIQVDLIGAWVKKSRKRALVFGSLNYILMMLFSLAIVWQSIEYGMQLQETYLATMTLRIPRYPFAYFIAFSYFCTFLAVLISFKNLWLNKQNIT